MASTSLSTRQKDSDTYISLNLHLSHDIVGREDTIARTIAEETDLALNKVIDREVVPFLAAIPFTLQYFFGAGGVIGDPSYAKAGFTKLELTNIHTTKAFTESIFVFEFFDSDRSEGNRRIAVQYFRASDAFAYTTISALQVITDRLAQVVLSAQNQGAWILIPKNSIKAQIYLRPSFFNAKSGRRTYFEATPRINTNPGLENRLYIPISINTINRTYTIPGYIAPGIDAVEILGEFLTDKGNDTNRNTPTPVIKTERGDFGPFDNTNGFTEQIVLI